MAIEHYHTKQVSHLLERSAFIGMRRNQKPAGYVTWEPSNDLKKNKRATQLAVSLEDLPALQRAVASRLGEAKLDLSDVGLKSIEVQQA